MYNSIKSYFIVHKDYMINNLQKLANVFFTILVLFFFTSQELYMYRYYNLLIFRYLFI